MKFRKGPCRLLICLIAFAALSACSGIADDTATMFRSLADGEKAEAHFSVPMDDSTGIYTLSLIARFNKGEGPDSLIMNITLTSPDNIIGSETVTFPSGYYIIKRYVKDHPEDRRIMLASTPDYYDICWEYRSGIIPPVPGDWEIAITLPDSPEGLRGIGITIKSEQHGKRQDT